MKGRSWEEGEGGGNKKACKRRDLWYGRDPICARFLMCFLHARGYFHPCPLVFYERNMTILERFLLVFEIARPLSLPSIYARTVWDYYRRTAFFTAHSVPPPPPPPLFNGLWLRIFPGDLRRQCWCLRVFTLGRDFARLPPDAWRWRIASKNQTRDGIKTWYKNQVIFYLSTSFFF